VLSERDPVVECKRAAVTPGVSPRADSESTESSDGEDLSRVLRPLLPLVRFHLVRCRRHRSCYGA
jgi:hypothetical protein